MITKRPEFSLVHLSDGELLSSLGTVLGSHRKVTAELIAHLAEMDARKLYLAQATSSLFVYCVQRLGFGEDEACRRIDAARLAHRFPAIYRMLASGEVSLSVLGRLKSVITRDNVDELLALVRGRSVRDAERLLAERFPRPDVADRIRKLPGTNSDSERGPRADIEGRKPRELDVERGNVGQEPKAAKPSESALFPPNESPASTEPDVSKGKPAVAVSTTKRHERKPGNVTPLATDRFQVTLTMSRAQKEKLRLALDLTSHQNPKRELATVIEAALDLLIDDRMRHKFGKTKRPREKKRAAKRTHVTNATRRAVVERDGLQCSFVDAIGNRCSETRFLELDHMDPRALGGGSEKERVRVLCRAHNQGEAEQVFGRDYVERKKRGGRKLEVREALATRYVAGKRLRLAGRKADLGILVGASRQSAKFQ